MFSVLVILTHATLTIKYHDKKRKENFKKMMPFAEMLAIYLLTIYVTMLASLASYFSTKHLKHNKLCALAKTLLFY